MISEAARTRPTTTSSHNEAPTGADNTTAMMMPLPDLDRLKGPQDRLCCLVLCMGAGLLVTMAKLGRASVRLHNRSRRHTIPGSVSRRDASSSLERQAADRPPSPFGLSDRLKPPLSRSGYVRMNPDGRLREYRTIYTHPASGAETQLLTVRPPRPEPVRNLQGTVGTCAFAKRLTQRDIPTARAVHGRPCRSSGCWNGCFEHRLELTLFADIARGNDGSRGVRLAVVRSHALVRGRRRGAQRFHCWSAFRSTPS